MKILITGAAGFIGFHLAEKLLKNNIEVIGLDNINSYYLQKLKYDRLKNLGISKNDIKENKQIKSKLFSNFIFYKTSLENKNKLDSIFSNEKPTIIINLAAQAGVRYSLINPDAYIQSNIVGFTNILEMCKTYEVKDLIYASSSSVYGKNKKLPFSTDDNVDHPISLYAATKKSNELLAHTYSHLFNIRTIGLRFFTVYGPWGRPDMALFLFVKAALEDKEIDVYNYGKMSRDFTYVDDIVNGIHKLILKRNNIFKKYKTNYRIYNIGNSNPVKLGDFIIAIEKKLKMELKKRLLPIQPGDVSDTFSDVKNLINDCDYKPDTKIEYGVSKFIDWYRDYYNL